MIRIGSAKIRKTKLIKSELMGSLLHINNNLITITEQFLSLFLCFYLMLTKILGLLEKRIFYWWK